MILKDLLAKYLSGEATIGDLDEWLSTYQWDALPANEAASAGLLYVLITEVGENLRQESELRRAVEEVLRDLERPIHIV